MAVRAYGQLVVQATMPAEDPVMVGTLWADTATGVLKQCTSVSPYTFVSIGGTGVTLANHNDLANIQGGTTSQYYHLTSAQHAAFVALAATRVPFVSGAAGVLDDDAGFTFNDTTKEVTAAAIIQSGVETVTTTGSITGLATAGVHTIRMNNASEATIHGLAAGVQGQQIRIISIGAGNVLLAHQSSTDGTATNRLINPVTSGHTPLAAGKGAADFEYDGTTGRWRLVAHSQGGFIAVTFAAGDFTGNNSMTWTVASGDVAADGYMVVGRSLVLAFRYTKTTVGGTPSTLLLKTIPNGYTFSAGWDAIFFAEDNGTKTTGWCFNNSSTQIGFAKLAGGNWAAATDTTKIAGSLLVPIN